MNTVKYRALAKDGTWRYGIYPCLNNVDMGNTKYPMDIFWNKFLSSFRRETLGLWTVKLDKHGKEIYEGDVLSREAMLNWLVEWRDGGFVSKNITGIYEARSYPLTQASCGDREVIGNIHSNPELLEASK